MKHWFIFVVLIASHFHLSAQSYNSFYGGIVSNTSSSNVLNDLSTFESFGVKRVGSSALTNTENWITARYQNLGYTDVVLQPFTHSTGMSNNIIVTKKGTVYPNTFLIIDAHYDTIKGPGTNDNGTGTILVLELARLLKDIETEYSIKFIHFSGEEDGLIGSKYYVNNIVIPQNTDIRLVLNIDEVGGVAGLINDTIVCERDQSGTESNNAASAAATNILAKCMELYSNLTSEISHAYSSDYISFEKNGEIITGLYEKNVSPVNHTAKDNLVNMDPTYTFEVIKGALGAVLQFAVAYNIALSSTDELSLESSISVHLNLVNKLLNINQKSSLDTPVNFRLIDVQGKEVLNQSLQTEREEINFDSLSRGEYLAVFKKENQRLFKKVILD